MTREQFEALVHSHGQEFTRSLRNRDREAAAHAAVLAAWDDLARDLTDARDLYRETEIRRCEALTALGRAEEERDALARRLAEAELGVAGYRAQIAMTVTRLGGKVEGHATHSGNFLQRIDALRAAESRALAAEARFKAYEDGQMCCPRAEAAEGRARALESNVRTLANAIKSIRDRHGRSSTVDDAERLADSFVAALASTPEAPLAPSAEEATGTGPWISNVSPAPRARCVCCASVRAGGLKACPYHGAPAATPDPTTKES